MQINPDDFRRLYASLSDEALLEIQPADLTDVARQCYDSELAQRRLKNEASSDVAEGSGSSSEDLVEVGFFESTEELGFARGLLRAAEIPAFSQNEAKMAGKLFGISGGLNLLVPREYEDRAREILDAPFSDEELAAQAEAAAMEEDSEFGDAIDPESTDQDK